MMKTKFAALAGTLALTLLMSTVWGAKGGPDLGLFLPSAAEPEGWGVQPLPADGLGDVLLGACPAGTTPFLLEFKSLQQGSPGDPTPPSGIPLSDSNQKLFLVPDPLTGPFEVTVTITVNSDNTFRFDVTGGFMHKIKSKAGLGTVVYDYLLIDPSDGADPDAIGKVSFDAGLNERVKRSQAVSHLDFCLSHDGLPPNTEFISSCLEPVGGVVQGVENLFACNPSGVQQVELPFALGGPQFGNETVTQALVPAKEVWDMVEDPNMSCVGESIAKDTRVDDNGNLSGPAVPLNLEDLFNLSGIDTAIYPNGVFLRENVVGSPCLALIFGQSSTPFQEMTATVEGRYTLTVTQYAEDVDGMFDGVDRITAPLCGSLGALSPLDCTTDLQFVEQASLQTDDLADLVEDFGSAFTSDAFNGSRTRSSRGTFYFVNTREVCLDIDPTLGPLDPDPKPYFAAVQQCKKDLALVYADNLGLAMLEAEPNLVDISINNLFTPFNKFRSMVKTGNWRKARKDLGQLENLVATTRWDKVDTENDPGGLLVRIANLFWRIDLLEETEAQHRLK